MDGTEAVKASGGSIGHDTVKSSCFDSFSCGSFFLVLLLLAGLQVEVKRPTGSFFNHPEANKLTLLPSQDLQAPASMILKPISLILPTLWPPGSSS